MTRELAREAGRPIILVEPERPDVWLRSENFAMTEIGPNALKAQIAVAKFTHFLPTLVVAVVGVVLPLLAVFGILVLAHQLNLPSGAVVVALLVTGAISTPLVLALRRRLIGATTDQTER